MIKCPCNVPVLLVSMSAATGRSICENGVISEVVKALTWLACCGFHGSCALCVFGCDIPKDGLVFDGVMSFALFLSFLGKASALISVVELVFGGVCVVAE